MQLEVKVGYQLEYLVPVSLNQNTDFLSKELGADYSMVTVYSECFVRALST
jgi:hypothetical protein